MNTAIEPRAGNFKTETKSTILRCQKYFHFHFNYLKPHSYNIV